MLCGGVLLKMQTRADQSEAPKWELMLANQRLWNGSYFECFHPLLHQTSHHFKFFCLELFSKASSPWRHWSIGPEPLQFKLWFETLFHSLILTASNLDLILSKTLMSWAILLWECVESNKRLLRDRRPGQTCSPRDTSTRNRSWVWADLAVQDCICPFCTVHGKCRLPPTWSIWGRHPSPLCRAWNKFGEHVASSESDK